MELSEDDALPCITQGWNQNRASLKLYLLKETKDPQLTDELLQEIFLRLLSQNQSFCQVKSSRSWLFRVAKNLLIDHWRKQALEPLNYEPKQELHQPELFAQIAIQCLPRALSELHEDDAKVLSACDLEGMTQKEFAIKNGLSLPAVKSRILRARQKLQTHMQKACQIKFDENQKVCGFTPRTLKK